jgi:hypothetical protein
LTAFFREIEEKQKQPALKGRTAGGPITSHKDAQPQVNQSVKTSQCKTPSSPSTKQEGEQADIHIVRREEKSKQHRPTQKRKRNQLASDSRQRPIQSFFTPAKKIQREDTQPTKV